MLLMALGGTKVKGRIVVGIAPAQPLRKLKRLYSLGLLEAFSDEKQVVGGLASAAA